MIERDAYGVGQHRWNSRLLQMARDYGFVPKACRPYRARTKGKVERFNGYLKRSFIVPLAATLKQAGLELDVDTANARIGASGYMMLPTSAYTARQANSLRCD